MNTNEDTKNELKQNVDLREFALMAGFPIELIRKELFENDVSEKDEVSLDELRAAMLNYLDSAMLKEE